jgi:multidrug resistance efflux pump
LTAAQRAVWANQQAVANARGTLSTTVESAQIALRTAQLMLDHAQRDYDHLLDLKKWGNDVDDQIKSAALQLENARAQLAIAQRDAAGAPGRTSQSVATAQQALAAAQAQYEALERRPEADQVKAAELAVDAARLALKQAETNLDEAVIRAPLAGTVAELSLKPGQAATPGQPVMTLADTSVWVVETSNLTELNVVDLEEGHPASVKFDAIPGLEMAGHIDWISLRAQQRQGDVVYTARVILDDVDPRLRWGMTTFVQFEE